MNEFSSVSEGLSFTSYTNWGHYYKVLNNKTYSVKEEKDMYQLRVTV